MMALRRNLCFIRSNAINDNIFLSSKTILPPPSHTSLRLLPSSHYQHLRPFSSQTPPEIPNHKRKRLDIAIVGLPNAGKSQLLNSLIGKKVAAVSRKRHTTRRGILAARTIDDTQLVFVDTPGFMHHDSSGKEGVRKLAAEASSEMDEVDYVLLVMDGAKKMDEEVKRTLVMLMFLALRSRGRREDGMTAVSLGEAEEKDAEKERGKLAVVINKVDLVSPKEKLLVTAGEVGSMADSCIRLLLEQRRSPSRVRLGDLVQHVLEGHADESGFDGVHEDDIEIFATLTPEFHFTSAITNDDEGVEDLLGMLLERATPTKEWIVEEGEDSVTPMMTPVEIVEEVIREKIYRCLHREVPHNVAQQNRLFRYSTSDSNDDDEQYRILHISQDLIVRTKSHQRLVLGSGGKTLERIRMTAIKDLEESFQCMVDLDLNVRLTKSMHDVPLESENIGAISRTIDG